MTYARATFSDDLDTLPRMPDWVTSSHAKTPEDVAFLSGAALATLHAVVEPGGSPPEPCCETAWRCAPQRLV